MTHCLRILSCLAVLLTTTLSVSASTSEVARAASLMVLGNASTTIEGADSLASALEQAKQTLTTPAVAAAVAAKAEADAFGGADVGAPTSSAQTYAARVADHVTWLSKHPEAYAKVLQQAYRFVINRDVYEEEIAYWSEQPATLSYVMLVACIEDWARRNQPGLMVTAGKPTVSVNCEFLATARLTPADAAVARDFIGLGEPASPELRVIAPGAATLRSGGGIHFVAVGAD